MITPLAFLVIALTVGLAVFGVATTLIGGPAARPHVLAVGITEALLVVQALLGGIKVLAGLRPAETSTFLIYLLVSVCLLPLALQFARAEPTRWGGAVVAVGALGTAVVELRLLQLWAGTSG